jgi:uncharacterized membrane protein
MTAPLPHDERDKHWLVRRSTIRILWIVSSLVLAITVLFDLAVDQYEIFGVDGTFGFAAWYGFLTCVTMVLAAKGLGFFLKRSDRYYDDS